jgi:serine/threonine protein kinase
MPSPRSAWTADPVSRSSEDFSGMLGPIGEGSVIADRYRIDAFIGQGGMGTVYRATDMELEEVVAIKVFQQVVQNTKGLERFRREMKLSRKLIHPNVVRIYEFGTWRGARYITMELLSGLDLEEYLKSEGGTLPTAQALSLMMQCCDGLIAAHKQGVVHRDIKPQNLFVVENGKRIKIMDFGIAKVSNGTSISITGVRVGTPRYMSPEQIQGGGQVGPPADLYALGGVMYELFTGSPVFDEEELVPLLLNHMTEEPVPPSERNPGLSAEIEHIILRLLQKDPENRYRDAAELKRELLSAYVQAERLPSR